jgi:cytosine/adenosine deaminase-related metal-dependent hydrolase
MLPAKERHKRQVSAQAIQPPEKYRSSGKRMDLNPDTSLLRLDASIVADARRTFAPGSLLLELERPVQLSDGQYRAGIRVLGAGRHEEIDAHPASSYAWHQVFPQGVLIPGLVNAHAHLDLTPIGPARLTERGFLAFVDTVRTHRPVDDQAIADGVRQGINLCIESGVVAVGDIAGSPRGRIATSAYETLAQSSLRGVSYLEFFALGPKEDEILRKLEEIVNNLPHKEGGVRLGLQPHAPYTVSPQAYRRCQALAESFSLPLSTHLAETPEEREFIESATGPLRVFLESVGMWDRSLAAVFGQGRRPVRHLHCVLSRPATPLILAHVHDLHEDEVELVRSLGASVVYCPSAGEYFGTAEHFGAHKYLRLLEAGVNVALGTDSIINLPEARLSIWREMQLLLRRDGTDPHVLLQMATINGARALGLDEAAFVFETGNRIAGVALIDKGCPGLDLGEVIRSSHDATTLMLGE